MHKYAMQVTVADVRDGALSSSTLKEACSWGKVDTIYEQMVFSEATLALPLIAGYACHKGGWKAARPNALAVCWNQPALLQVSNNYRVRLRLFPACTYLGARRNSLADLRNR